MKILILKDEIRYINFFLQWRFSAWPGQHIRIKTCGKQIRCGSETIPGFL